MWRVLGEKGRLNATSHFFWVLRELGAVEPMKKRSGCLGFFSGVMRKTAITVYWDLGENLLFLDPGSLFSTTRIQWKVTVTHPPPVPWSHHLCLGVPPSPGPPGTQVLLNYIGVSKNRETPQNGWKPVFQATGRPQATRHVKGCKCSGSTRHVARNKLNNAVMKTVICITASWYSRRTVPSQWRFFWVQYIFARYIPSCIAVTIYN